jgi:hypothetical protein
MSDPEGRCYCTGAESLDCGENCVFAGQSSEEEAFGYGPGDYGSYDD